MLCYPSLSTRNNLGTPVCIDVRMFGFLLKAALKLIAALK